MCSSQAARHPPGAHPTVTTTTATPGATAAADGQAVLRVRGPVESLNPGPSICSPGPSARTVVYPGPLAYL